MNKQTDEYNKWVANYYDSCQKDYEWVWHLKKKMAMHYGYWDKETHRHRDSLHNMNLRVAEYAGVKEGDLILDAGCGVGGSSISLAKLYGCRTQGITLSGKQVESCRKNARAEGVEEKCSFDLADYTNTGFPDNTFDVVWAIESVCYARDKNDFLKEAFRILKPGGTLVVADFFGSDQVEDAKNHPLMIKMAETWAIERFANGTEFHENLLSVGFVDCGVKDISANVEKSVDLLLRLFRYGLVPNYLLRVFRRRNKTMSKNFWSAYYQSKAFRKGLWNYVLFRGVKPS